jgi:hypothetical protein
LQRSVVRRERELRSGSKSSASLGGPRDVYQGWAVFAPELSVQSGESAQAVGETLLQNLPHVLRLGVSQRELNLGEARDGGSRSRRR